MLVEAFSPPVYCLLFLDSLDVVAGLRVDAYHVAFIDEDGHIHLGSGLESRWFFHVCCCVALESWLGVVNSEVDVWRNLNGEYLIALEAQIHSLVFLYEAEFFADGCLFDWDLLVVALIHEVEQVSILIKVLEGARFDADKLYAFAGIVLVLRGIACAEVAHLYLEESAALAGLAKLHVGYLAVLAVVFYHCAGAQIACVGHVFLSFGREFPPVRC